MFTVTQSTENGDKLWPGVSHIFTEVTRDTSNAPGTINRVTALFSEGGLMDFDAGESIHHIYVMNERGATVAKYHLGGRKSHTPSDQKPI